MNHSRQLATNTAINALNTVISFAVSYAMTPFIVHRLGLEAYGVWVFLGIFSIAGYFSLLDFGFQGATIKFIAEYRAHGDTERMQGVVSLTLRFFGAVGLAAAIALAVFNLTALPTVFHLPAARIALVQLLVNLTAASFLVQFPGIAFAAILEGMQRYDLLRGISLITTVLSNAVLVVFLRSEQGLALVVGSTLAAAVLLTVGYGIAVKRILPEIRFTLRASTERVRAELFHLSSRLFASKLVGLIFNNTDRIIIGIFLTLADQTNYDVVNRLHASLLALLSIINQAVLPATAALAAQGDREGLRTLLLRSTKYAAALVLPGFLFLIVFPREFLTAWVGASFGTLAPLVVLYCGHFALTSLVGVSSTMLVGVNRVERTLAISIGAALLNLGISLATVHRFGIGGLMAGTAIAYALSSLLYIVITNREFGISQVRFLRSVVAPLVPMSVVLAAGFPLLRGHLHIVTTLGWVLIAAIGYLVFLGGFVLFGLSRPEREFARQLILRGRDTGTNEP